MHVLVYDGRELIGHGAVVMRRMLNGGRALRTGYVESVAVRADRRRTGIGGVVMSELERVIRGGYELGALGASPVGAALYLSRGWWRWPGTCAVFGPDGVRPTPEEDGGLYVLPVSVNSIRAGRSSATGATATCGELPPQAETFRAAPSATAGVSVRSGRGLLRRIASVNSRW